MRSITGLFHEQIVFDRRVRVLADCMAPLLPAGAHVLDVGCGDGTVDVLIGQKRPDVRIEGIDVLVRPQTKIVVTAFDGKTIPFPDGSFDAAMFVDVLHHTDDPLVLLREAARVAPTIIIKDHCRDGLLAGPTLRFMDYVGNAHHGVVLPYNYWRRRQWDDAFRTLGLTARAWSDRLGLYVWPASLLFDRNLHFVASLSRS